MRILFFVIAVVAMTPAHAAERAFPVKPVRLLVPYPPGGGNDTMARTIGARLTEEWHQQVIIDNRAGANGLVAAELTIAAAPDGYTLFMANIGSHAINPALYKNLPYDAVKDFAPVSQLGSTANVLVVHPSVPAKNLQELIALSKTTPVNIGTSGAGSASHMTLARFNAATGANFTHVPYRGGGALIPDLLSGSITGAMTELSTALPQVPGGKVRVLGVAWSKRSPQVPDAPTMIEQGVKDFTAASYVGFLAPVATGADIVKTLEAALIKALNQKDLQDKMLKSGAELVPDDLMTSKGFADYIKKEYDLTREAAKIAGLTPT